MGGSVPATIAGATVVNNAELIAGIVLAQLIRPGAKVIVQNYVFPMNMRSGIPAFGSIECSLHNVIFNQYFRRFGVPTYFVNTGPVSSKIPDFQTGSEKTFLGILTALSGAHIMLLCGSLFGELVSHPVQAILDNDLSGMIKRFLQGVNVDEESLALDLIKKVGPIPGHYLDKEHTRVFWKKEHFVPKVSDRQSLQEWVATGKKTALDNAKKRMKEILDTHEPIWLSPGQEDDIKRILEEARKYYKKKDMME
jgi:trimethylamine--corrinoid protein Co-methyltransferase